ncbi:MAG: hypothetical protein ACI85O_003285, partial [Saprospiraceae bacterium]
YAVVSSSKEFNPDSYREHSLATELLFCVF